MRKDLLHIGATKLSYEIREIVDVANKLQKINKREVVWENIGDPVEKGEKIPDWLKNMVTKACNKDEVYGYSPTRGLEKTLNYLALKSKKIKKEDILFFNGLGDAINKIYKNLSATSRVIGPNPAYSTHSSAEAAHAGSEHITYRLNPENNWNPDLEELENKVKYNPNIVAILVVNPDNPTGAVFKRDILEKIIDIAREFNLFVIFDEIYEKLTYDKNNKVLLSEIIGDVPGISMKGISKELPWPGARCGWIEVYNKDKDENFADYIDSILASKMLEVCSTTLPQYIIPEIYDSKEFSDSIDLRIKKYQKRANMADEIFENFDYVSVVKPKGAFYLSVVFNLDKLNLDYEFDYEDKKIEKIVENKIGGNSRFDKKFCYHLLAKESICIVPLSSFNSSYDGFRVTLLEENFEKYKFTLNRIKKFIEQISK